jgi:streptogramin lyase
MALRDELELGMGRDAVRTVTRPAIMTAWLAATLLIVLLAVAPSASATLVGTGGFGNSGSGQGDLSAPAGIAFSSNGDVWVADSANGRVEVFVATTGALVRSVSGFAAPVGLAIGSDDSVFVSDAATGTVTKLGPDGSVDPRFTSTGFIDPRALAYDANTDEVYVVERSRGRVRRVDADTGAVIAPDVLTGLVDPAGVAVDQSGAVAVTERGADRVRLLIPGQSPTIIGVGQVQSPTGVVFDPYGSIVVAEEVPGRLRRFQQFGALIDEFIGLGGPTAIATDGVQRFAISEGRADRIRLVDDVLAPPVLGQTANLNPLSGDVLVRRAPDQPFRRLTRPEQVHFGAELDTTDGAVRLVSAQPQGGTEQATLSRGRALITQPGGLVTERLSGPGLAGCPRRAGTRAVGRADGSRPGRRTPRARLIAKLAKGKSASSRKRPPRGARRIRLVRTKVKGRLRTIGKHATATVRGTDYLVADYCEGTLVTVFDGVVGVTRANGAFVRDVRAGDSVFIPS